MPWTVKERDGRYCVVNKDSGETEKCHGSRSDANDHLKALYANTDEADLSAAEKLELKLARVYVPEHKRLNAAGKVVTVKGHWREVKGGFGSTASKMPRTKGKDAPGGGQRAPKAPDTGSKGKGAPDAPEGKKGGQEAVERAAKGVAPEEAKKASGLSDVEYQQRTQLVEQRLDEAFAKGLNTDAKYAIDLDAGHWEPERAKMHKEVVEEMFNEIFRDVPSEGKAAFTGGLGGSGKGTTLREKKPFGGTSYGTIDPDAVKERLARRGLVPELEGLTPGEASALIHEESSHIAMMLADRAQEERKNMIWDITMSSSGSVERRLDTLESNGYRQIDAIFVDIPVETSVERALSRHRNGVERALRGEDEFGGRYVPPKIIRKSADPEWGSRNRAAFESVKERFASWRLYDNSVPGRGPVEVARSGGSTQQQVAASAVDRLSQKVRLARG